MNAAHLHLILNHIPVIGLPLMLIVLIVGLAIRNLAVQQTALALLVVIAVLTVPVFLSGEGAEEYFEDSGDLIEHLVHEHEESAELAYILTLVSGVIALSTLLLRLKWKKLELPLLILTVALSIAATGSLCQAANFGGKINHPEIWTEEILSEPMEIHEEE